jgi:hypothetical protein
MLKKVLDARILSSTIKAEGKGVKKANKLLKDDNQQKDNEIAENKQQNKTNH